MNNLNIVNGKPRYDVGDKVTILPEDKFPTSNHVGAVSSMFRYCGKVREISDVDKREWGYAYRLKDTPYTWENSFFENGSFALSRDTGGAINGMEGLSDFISLFTVKG